MDVLHYDGLAVPSPASIEGLEQVILEFDQFVGVAAVDRDVLFAQVTLAQLDHAEPGEASDDDLNSYQSVNLGLRSEGGDRREGCVERRLFKEVVGVRPQTGDHLSHHGVGELLRKCPKRCP